ncbi:hypothetical protein ABEB36_004967 [Hypothenemus hampei]|uniref:Proton channel OtopLc n=1 Tax=Hypothenemus hampei TaxID=57062 RepID=A0ABD1EWG8_HYPHA
MFRDTRLMRYLCVSSEPQTSLFIIMSFVYAKLLVVVCIAYVFSDVVTHNIPLYYYEGFFTYLYGMSILFLLYVFCFLLQESSCCAGSEKVEKVKPPPKQKPKDKEKELKKEEEEKKKKKEKEKEEKKKKDKEKDKEKKSKKQEKQKASTSKTKPDGSRDPDFNISFSFEDIKGPGSQQQQQQEGPPPPQPPPPPTNASGTNNVDVESGAVVQQHQVQKTRCKRKTTQSEHSHGSFFLRIGAIAFGLGTMIYNGLEFGVFFEIPFTSPCYMILRGVNPLLQMIFTFMQMYFIFMNSRLNIHRFKVVARFGLMHVVATNLCVWIRTLVLEYIKEITIYHRELLKTTLTLPTTTLAPFAVAEESEFSNEFSNAISENGTEFLDNLTPQAFIRYFTKNFTGVSNDSCGRINIMGTIVQDSAPYLFPFIIEYSLIGAAVIYCIWKHIGRYPRYETQEDLEHRLELMLSRRAVAIAQAQQGRVDCVGASKGLFFGLLMLVASLICLILFFVLVHHKELGLLAIYLADVSHCVLMILSIIAIIIGFIRVQNLKFRTEEQSDLNDILLRVSAFGLFTYAVFSVIAGHYKAFTVEPNMLVMVTGILSVAQVILQLLFIADVSRRRVHLPEHDRTKPGRQVVTFLLICNITMWIIYTFETQKVEANPVQKRFYGFLTWAIVQRLTLPLCIFHRFHSAVTLAEIWKTSYKARLE